MKSFMDEQQEQEGINKRAHDPGQFGLFKDAQTRREVFKLIQQRYVQMLERSESMQNRAKEKNYAER